MAELIRHNNRVFFKSGKQKEFILEAKKKMGVKTEKIANTLGVHPRTFRDWQREKFSMSLSSVKAICRLTQSPVPNNVTIKDQFWYASLGAKRGWEMTMKKYGRVPVDEEYRKNKWYEWWEKDGKFKKHPIINVSKPFNKPSPSKGLAEFIGIMMGDGGMTHKQISITLHHSDDLEFSYFVTKLINKLFNVNPSVVNIPKDSVNRILISRSGLVRYLNSLGLVIGDKVRQKFDIPEWVKKDEDYLRFCIRGLMDTDGCVFRHKYKVKNKEYSYKKLSFTSASKPLRESVFNAFKKWGLNPRISSDRDVRLESVGDVRRYFKEIGSHNPKHLKKYYN